MIGRWKKIRSFLAITLCAAMIVTAVPDFKMVSHAAEEPVSTAEAIEEPIMPGEPVVEEPAISGGDVVAPTVSDGDFVSEIELYQSRKLSVKVQNATIFTGQQNISVAQIGYEKTTSDEGYGYEVTDIRLGSLDMQDMLSCDTSNPEELKVSVKRNATPGKYTITLLPLVPAGIHAEPVTITLDVVASITNLILGYGTLIVYKTPDTAATFQVKPLHVQAYNGLPAYKPDALKWTVMYAPEGSYIPYEGKDITVSAAGKVTIGKEYDAYRYPQLRIVCQANDYDGNSASDFCDVVIYSSVLTLGTAVIIDSNKYCFRDGDDVTAASLNGKRLAVSLGSDLTPGNSVNGDIMDGREYTYKSSSKDVLIDSNGYITVVSVSGKPVTLTATTLDGKTNKSITLNLKKKTFTMDELEIDVRTHFFSSGSLGTITKDTPGYTLEYAGTGNETIGLKFRTTEGTDIHDMTVSVKGGKNITSGYFKSLESRQKIVGGTISIDSREYVVIIPTAKVVEVTVKSGKESRVYKIVNKNYSVKKITPQKGEPRITTSAGVYKINDYQLIRIYVGKQNVGGKVYLGVDPVFYYTNYGNKMMYDNLFYRCMNSRVEYVDSDGYVTFGISNFSDEYSSLVASTNYYKGVKLPNSMKFQMTVQNPDGSFYAPASFTIKIMNGMPKTDYKLQTNYKITKTRIPNTFHHTLWTDTYGYEDYYFTDEFVYYQQLTYTGSKEPSDTMEITGVEMELGKNLLNAADLAYSLCIGQDSYGSYYLAVCDDDAYSILCAANAKVLAEGKDVSKYGKDGKVDGTIYVSYRLTTKEGYKIDKTDKVKVSIVVPKTDYKRLTKVCN